MEEKNKNKGNGKRRPQSIEKMRRPQSGQAPRKSQPSERKQRPQSIEKMRRPQQKPTGRPNAKRRDYSDGFSYDIDRREAPKRRSADSNIYDFPSVERERRDYNERDIPRSEHKKQRPRPDKGQAERKKAQERERKARAEAERKKAAAKEKREAEKQTRKPRQKKPVSAAKLRFRRFLLSFLAISAVILIGAYLSLTVWFKTENIRIVGETRYSAERVLEACTIHKGENIFLADKKTAAEAIKNALPYVETAEVKFSIPDTIVVKVTDAVPAYQIGADGGYYAVSAQGRILEKYAQQSDSVPTVECSGLKNSEVGGYVEFEDENVPQILSDVVSELNALQIHGITVIDITSAANVKLFYDGRILIVVGVPEEINYKLRTAMTIINDKLDPNDSGIIKGRLDVSRVNETKKSYFNENEIYVPPSQQKPSLPAVSEADETQENTDSSENGSETSNEDQTDPPE